MGSFAPGRDFHRLARIPQGIVDEIHDRAANADARQRQFPGGGRRGDPHILAEARVMLRDIAHQGVQIRGFAPLNLAAGKIEKLADHLIHFIDVGAHALDDGWVSAAHLQRKAKARQGSAQVVRDAREHHRSLVLHACEVAGHAVERRGDGAQFLRAFLRERLGSHPASHKPRGPGQVGKRTGDARCDEPRRDQRQDKGKGAPANPFQRYIGSDPLARKHDPVFVFVDEEAHPEPLGAVPRPGHAGALAEHEAHELRHPVQQRFLGHRLESLARGGRVHANALDIRELAQQAHAALGVGVDERRARQVDDRNGLFGKLGGEGFALVGAQDAQPDRERGDNQKRDQQKRPREQGHFTLPSGTNT